MKTIRSKPRSIFKHIIFGVFILCMFYLANFSDSDFAFAYAVGGFFAFFTLLEILLYSRTTLTLTEDELQVNRTAFVGLVKERYSISLKEIRSTHYEVQIHDFSFWRDLILEFIFPTGQSILTILLLDGSKKEVIFNGRQQQLRKFLKELPDRTPNSQYNKV